MQTLDPTTEGGAKALDRLRSEEIGWLTTVTPDGQPQSSPVWFLWQDGAIVIYSQRRARRNGNIADQPRVSFNVNTDATGDEYVTIEGIATLEAGPPATTNPEYVAKYTPRIEGYGWTVEWFAGEYPFLLRIAPTRVRVG
jgi:PPOX class probable F420-dependent enzyme